MTLKSGIHQMSMSEYLALKALSSSLCHTLLTHSPHHAKFQQDNRRDDANEQSDAGTAIHDALLEGYDRIVAVDARDWKTQAAREARDTARSQGKIPLLAHKVPQIEGAVQAALQFVASTELSGIFMRGKAEQTLIWQEGDIFCKARPDWLTDERDVMLHVKTTSGSAEPNSWIRNQLVPSGYDVSAMFYQRGADELLAQSNPQTVFLVIEQNPPYGCSLISLSPAMQDLASRKVERAIRTWADCTERDKWPGYPTQIVSAEPFAWQMQEQDDREFHDFELGGQP